MNVLRGRRRTGVAGAAVVVVLAVIALVLVQRGEGEEPSLAGGERPAGSVSLSREALWGADRAEGVEVHRGAVVVVSETSMAGLGRVEVRDAASGKRRWAVEEREPLGEGLRLADGYARLHGHGQATPLLVGSGDDWSVLVAYEKRLSHTRSEQGIAALSGKDGGLRWKKALPGIRDSWLMDARDGRILVAGDRQDFDGVISYALDARHEGRMLWKHRGDDWVFALAGDVALGEHQGPDEVAWAPVYGPGINDGGSVFALDARTGRKKWDLRGRHYASGLTGAVGGRAVISTAEERDQEGTRRPGAYVLNTATGAKTDDLGRGPVQCERDSRARLLACLREDGSRLTTVRSGPHNRPVSAAVPAVDRGVTGCCAVDSVRNSRVYVSGFRSEVRKKAAAVDRLGGTLRERLPGRVVATDGRHAAVLVDKRDADPRLSVHRVRERR